MLVIYDLDKTSLYCPIADFLDKFIPENIILKKFYYNIYPFVHIFEMLFGLLKINKEMYIRAKQYAEFPDTHQIVITARHKSFSLMQHVKAVFKDIDVTVFPIAQGLTKLFKVDVIDQLPCDDKTEIVMFDDNFSELALVNVKYKGQFTGVHIEFTGEEKLLGYVN